MNQRKFETRGRSPLPSGDHVSESPRYFRIEIGLIHTFVPPSRSSSRRDPFAPVANRLILGSRTLPDAALGLDDPVHGSALHFLNHHPVRVIKADCAIRLEI